MTTKNWTYSGPLPVGFASCLGGCNLHFAGKSKNQTCPEQLPFGIFEHLVVYTSLQLFLERWDDVVNAHHHVIYPEFVPHSPCATDGGWSDVWLMAGDGVRQRWHAISGLRSRRFCLSRRLWCWLGTCNSTAFGFFGVSTTTGRHNTARHGGVEPLNQRFLGQCVEDPWWGCIGLIQLWHLSLDQLVMSLLSHWVIGHWSSVWDHIWDKYTAWYVRRIDWLNDWLIKIIDEEDDVMWWLWLWWCWFW